MSATERRISWVALALFLSAVIVLADGDKAMQKTESVCGSHGGLKTVALEGGLQLVGFCNDGYVTYQEE